jgi:outer membrane protein OmpA-like peptidoglycan-associated protein
MAYDRSEPRVALIAKIGVIALVSLVGIKFALDSYWVQMNEAVVAEKMPAVYEPLKKLHDAEEKNLNQSATPITVAMQQLSQGGRVASGGPADIAPQPSDDLGPITGWSKMPKKGMSVPSGAELQSCKDAAQKDARLRQEKEVQKHGGSLNFNDIDFTPGTDKISTDKPQSAAALKELVAFAQGCAELRFDVTGHTSKEGAADKNAKLSEQRATSVKKALVAAGVPEGVFGKISGAGSTSPAVAEPEPDSDEAKKLGPEKLEAIRNVNRRITITVTTHCP